MGQGAITMKDLFVHKESIARQIWGNADTVLLIFAGASAEFALNKAVDWLYFTGRLPADPLGRLFSTVRYAQEIVFAEKEAALAAIDRISSIHQAVEKSRGASIPEWAYLDVLFLLIDYSIRSFELLNRKLTDQEKGEVFDVFYRVGMRMNLKGVPGNFGDWMLLRAEYLQKDLVCSDFTRDLYRQYKKSLGSFRYRILIHAQVLLTPPRVASLLRLPSFSLLSAALPVYKFARSIGMDKVVKTLLLPKKYKSQIAGLTVN
jgi:hypothetical protein